MIVPTRRFWLLVALGLGFPFLGLAVPGAEWAAVPYNLILLALLLIGARLVPGAADIAARRRFDPVLSVRVPNLVTLRLDNNSNLPLRGRLRDEPPSEFSPTQQEFSFDVPPGRALEFEYWVTPERRGVDAFSGTYVRLRTPLGLAGIQVKLDTDQPVRVYPNVQALREFDLLNQRGRLNLMGIRRTRRKGIGTDFESLRDYQEDDFGKIDWKSSARRGHLVVREYETERNQAVIVCVDTSRCMLAEVDGVTKIDHALDASLMLMHAAQVSGDQVGLMVFGDRVKRYVPPRKGAAQSAAILEALHDLEATPVAADPQRAFAFLGSRWKRRSLVVLFTDVDSEDSARALATALGPLARRSIVLTVRVADPRVKDLLTASPTDISALYTRAAAEWHAEGRRRAQAVLEAAHLREVEAEPQDLAAALVSTYLLVKETARL